MGLQNSVLLPVPLPTGRSSPCPLFGRCGECQIMHLAYPKQLEMKRQRVVDALQRIGKIDCFVAPCLPSPSPLAYRNKIQLPVRNSEKEIAFGLYARSSHDLVEVDTCPIHCSMAMRSIGRSEKSSSGAIKSSGIC